MIISKNNFVNFGINKDILIQRVVLGNLTVSNHSFVHFFDSVIPLTETWV
jgi:hypothetical protein